MAMKGDFVDERDKRSAADVLAAKGTRPEMHQRWVRFKGPNADSHMDRMRDKGYVPVARTKATEQSGNDPRMTVGQHAQLDGTIKRGDLMLMERPKDDFNKDRRAHAELTEARTRGALNKFKALGGYDER